MLFLIRVVQVNDTHIARDQRLAEALLYRVGGVVSAHNLFHSTITAIGCRRYGVTVDRNRQNAA